MGRSLRAVLNKKKLVPKGAPCAFQWYLDPGVRPARVHALDIEQPLRPLRVLHPPMRVHGVVRRVPRVPPAREAAARDDEPRAERQQQQDQPRRRVHHHDLRREGGAARARAAPRRPRRRPVDRGDRDGAAGGQRELVPAVDVAGAVLEHAAGALRAALARCAAAGVDPHGRVAVERNDADVHFLKGRGHGAVRANAGQGTRAVKRRKKSNPDDIRTQEDGLRNEWGATRRRFQVKEHAASTDTKHGSMRRAVTRRGRKGTRGRGRGASGRLRCPWVVGGSRRGRTAATVHSLCVLVFWALRRSPDHRVPGRIGRGSRTVRGTTCLCATRHCGLGPGRRRARPFAGERRLPCPRRLPRRAEGLGRHGGPWGKTAAHHWDGAAAMGECPGTGGMAHLDQHAVWGLGLGDHARRPTEGHQRLRTKVQIRNVARPEARDQRIHREIKREVTKGKQKKQR